MSDARREDIIKAVLRHSKPADIAAARREIVKLKKPSMLEVFDDLVTGAEKPEAAFDPERELLRAARLYAAALRDAQAGSFDHQRYNAAVSDLLTAAGRLAPE